MGAEQIGWKEPEITTPGITGWRLADWLWHGHRLVWRFPVGSDRKSKAASGW